MRKKNKYQRGTDYRPRGFVNRGSGRIDPNSSERLPVDDVNAVLGRGEYVINANAVDAVGVNFLNKVNNIGLNTGERFNPGVLPESNYQRGGRVNGRKKMPRRNLNRSRYRRGGVVRTRNRGSKYQTGGRVRTTRGLGRRTMSRNRYQNGGYATGNGTMMTSRMTAGSATRPNTRTLIRPSNMMTNGTTQRGAGTLGPRGGSAGGRMKNMSLFRQKRNTVQSSKPGYPYMLTKGSKIYYCKQPYIANELCITDRNRNLHTKA